MTQHEPSEAQAHTEKDTRALQSMLAKTQRDLRASVVFEGLLWLGATLAAVTLSALILGLLTPAEWGPLVFQIIFFGGSALSFAIAIGFWFHGTRTGDQELSVASALQHAHPALRNDLTAALQFARELEAEEATAYSPSLARAHIHTTVRSALGLVDGRGGLAHLVPQRDARPAYAAVALGVLSVLSVLLLFPEGTQALWNQSLGNTEAGASTHTRPVVGDIDVFLQHPAYTKRASEFIPFTTGHIETLIGTEVTLKTYPLMMARSYEMILETEDGQRALQLTQNQGRLEVEFVATKPGKYWFRGLKEDGTSVDDGIKRQIVLQPDNIPTVTITSHEGEVEVSPDEVLEIAFSVQDDYGIDSIIKALAFEGEKPGQSAMDYPELAATPLGLEAGLTLDLTPLGLQPKDVVTFQLIVVDNNTLTGPGRGLSAPITLRVASLEDKHMRAIDAQQEVLEELLNILASFLESPVGTREPNHKDFYEQDVPADIKPAESTKRYELIRAVHGELATVLTQMSNVVTLLQQDPLTLERDLAIFSALQEQLYTQHRDGNEVLTSLAGRANDLKLEAHELQLVANYAASMEDTLEKGLLSLEALLSTQKMDAIQSTAKEIKELKDRLRELLEKYKETRDPELKKAILREIKRLRARMKELMERMQSQLQELPQEHANLEAIQAQELQSDAQKIADSMQSIEDLLEKDDIDGALAELDRMTENLDSLTEDMDSQFAESQPEGLNELDKKLSDLMDKVNDLETQQRSVENQTADEQQKVLREHQERQKAMMKDMAKEVIAEVRKQKSEVAKLESKHLPKHDQEAVREAERRLGTLEDMLKQTDIIQALENAELSVQELRSLHFGLQLSERYAKSKSPQGKAIRGGMNKLDDIVPRGEGIRKKLDDMLDAARQQMASADQKQLDELSKRQAQVEKSAQQLEKQIDEAAEQFPMLQQQLQPGAESAREHMEGAKQSLEGNRVQKALDGQRQALDELGKLKKSMKQALKKERKGEQGKKMDREKVQIPQEDAGKASEAFRKSIMKNMKEERLEGYSDEIERYYKSLME